MHLFFRIGFACAWGAIVLVWGAGWSSARRTSQGPGGLRRFAPYLPMLVGLALIVLHAFPQSWIVQPLWRPSLAMDVAGLATTVLGVLFAIWARVTLGQNWSSVPQVKERHELVVSGPYRLVRHPIYTGLLLALAGTAMAVNRAVFLLVWVLLLVSYGLKIRREEQLMMEAFPEAYPEYRRRAKALIPFLL